MGVLSLSLYAGWRAAFQEGREDIASAFLFGSHQALLGDEELGVE
jgi:hypothetical protein